MAEKNLKARIVHKHDIEANWLLATGFTPKQGEIIVYDRDSDYPYERIKIGDGVQNVNDLPFYNDGFVSYNEQNLTDEQKAQARANIDAIANSDIPIKTVELTEIPNKFRVWEYDTGIYYIIPSSTVFAITVKTGTGDDTKEGGVMISGITKLPIFVNKYSNDSVDRWIYWYPSRSGFTSQQLEYSKTDLTWTVNTVEKLPALSGSPDIAGQTIRVNNDGKGYVLSNNVWSVNGQTDDVTITAEDIGAATQEYVSTLVGDTAVSEQIDAAIAEIPQADWSQNDESAVDYIKNKPFYEIPEVWIKADLIDDNWSGKATCKLASTPIEWTVDNSYRIRIDGVEYVFDGMSTRKATAATGMQDVYYIGATYIPLNSNMDFLEYKFCLLTTDFTNIYVVFEDATINHTIEFFESEREIHHLDPKYIKDMYYEEENLVNIAGLEYFVINPMSNGVTEYTYDYIPLELGQTWDVCYNPSNNSNFTAGDYSSMPVQEDEDGNLYIGDPEVNTYPFYITNNFIRVNANWYSIIQMTVVKIVGASGAITGEPIVHHLDPKYIKDMYYDNTIYTLTNINDVRGLVNNELLSITGPANELVEGLTFRVVVDGVIYDNVPVYGNVYYAGGDTIGIGDLYSGNQWRTTDYGFMYTHYGWVHNPDIFPNGIQSIEIYTVERKLKQIDPKYIKDMYYEEENVTDITGLSFSHSDFVFDFFPSEHNLNIPLALGQVWEMRYIKNTGGNNIESSYEGLEVKEAEDGTLYIGTYPDVNDLPFYITNNTDRVNSGWWRITNPTDISVTCISGTVVGEPIVHQIDPKYIKDMYHEEPVELFSVENAEFVDNEYMLETPFTIEDGNTYIVNWDGVEYTCEAYTFQGIPAIGNTAEFGGKGNGEPFVIGYNSYENVTFVNSFEDLATHTFSVVKMVYHTIAPKYIKDMYYEEVIKTDITGASYIIDGFDTSTLTVSHDPIPLKLGQVWEENHKHYSGNWTACGNYEVQQADDGTLYLGTPISAEDNIVAFYLTENELSIEASLLSAGYDTFKFTCISGVIDESIIHQIDTKYLPILEKVEETIIKANVTDFIELIGPEYGKLLGKYVVVIDGVSETVEFIDNGIGSFVETDSFAIESWTDPEGNVDNNGFTMEFANQDGNSHSVEILAIKDVIKEEYLPDSVTAKPDWNQSNPEGAGYIENRTHYDDKVHYLVDGNFVNIDIHQTYTVKIKDDVYENVPVDNSLTNNDPKWGFGTGGKLTFNDYPFSIRRYPVWPEKNNDILEGECTSVVFDETIYPDATIDDVEIYQRELKQLDPKYIKDMYYESGELITVVPETEIQNRYSIAFDNSDALTVGQKCIVTIDGTKYETTVRENVDFTINSGVNTYPIGIGSWMSADTTTQRVGVVRPVDDCPFALLLSNNDLVFFYETDNATNDMHAVEVCIEGCEIHQLDEKYIPDTIARTEDVDVLHALVGDTPVAEQINNAIVIATDDEIIELLAQEDMLPVVKDSDGSFLADENENIILW